MIDEYKGREKGRRGFVLGNAPSVAAENLDLLSGECVIGMNASPILEEQFNFKHSYYTLGDARFLQDEHKRVYSGPEYLPEETIRFVRSDLEYFDLSSEKDRTVYVQSLGRLGFSGDLERGFYHGCTTALFAVQLAHYLGCESIYLLGVDLSYDLGKPRFYKEVSKHPVDDLLSYQIYSMFYAYKILSGMGIELYVCSDYSRLRPYIPHVKLNEVFGES